MRQTFLTLTAESCDEAMIQAATTFQCPPEHIAVIPADQGQFRAELLDHDADLRVEVSPDKMSAIIVDSLPAKGAGQPLTQEDLLQKMTTAGVHVAPDPAIAARVLELLAAGGEVTGMVIAKGTLPRPPQDAFIEPVGDWNFPVFPEDAFGRYSPPRAQEPGMYVTGETLPCKGDASPSDVVLAKDVGCRLDRERSLIVAEQYGLASIEGLHVRIQPLLSVVSKKTAIKSTVYHRTCQGEPVTTKHFQDILKRMQVTAELQEESVRRAVDKAQHRNAPVENVILCWGILPKDGVDGRFEPVAVSTPDALGLETSDGRIDYRARGMIRSVQQGDLLGRLIPSQPGVPGVDVFGLPIPARPGLPFIVTPGENVQTSENGKDFFAMTEGMVLFLGNTLKVTEIFEIQGDVNLSVGNIKLEKGSVNVNGSVLAGFRVEAPGNVMIKEVVENAVVVAGGDVQVGYGIIMNLGGLVEAGGGISALYAQNATLYAQGDVNISHELNNCSVFAGRSVIVTRGRGKIIGGVLRCGEGVLAKEIGSPLGVETIIHLGVDHKSEVNLARKKDLEETLQKIYISLGTGDIRGILENTAPEKRQIVAEVLKARVRCEQELRDIADQIHQERVDFRSNVNIRVKILGVMYPDVVVNCFNALFKSTTTIFSPTIVYDPQQKTLVLA